MLPMFVDVFCAVVMHLVLMQCYIIGERTRTASVAFRLCSVFISYGLLFFVLDYFLNCILITVTFFTTANVSNGIIWFGMVIFNLILYRTYLFYDDKLQVREMSNFAYTSILFGNYFRDRDSDTRERIGTHRMKKIYEEVHGKPFTEEVLATPFDQQMTKFKKVPIEALNDRKRKPPPEYAHEIAQFNQRFVTDVTVSFRFELADNRSHPYFLWLGKCAIDPELRDLSMEIIFPSEKMQPVALPTERVRMFERVYEFLHVLIDQEWFSFYAPLISTVTVVCRQNSFNELMVETAEPVMRFHIAVARLKERAGRITTGSEIQRIAEIQFYPQ